MRFKLNAIAMAIMAIDSAMAHITMKDPPPLGYQGNPYTTISDYDIIAPLSADQYPCKGRTDLIGTPQGQAVRAYAPGERASMTTEGSATHNGGSCQLSLSYDNGKTFTVIKSPIGSCPAVGALSFDFRIPADAPEGDDVLFAWTWVNKTGQREFYTSCAVVNIRGSSGGVNSTGISGGAEDGSNNEKRADRVAFADRPQVFVANLGGEFCTVEGVDMISPDPGPDIESKAAGPGPPIYCSSGAEVEVPDSQSSESEPNSGSSGDTQDQSTVRPSSLDSLHLGGSKASMCVALLYAMVFF